MRVTVSGTDSTVSLTILESLEIYLHEVNVALLGRLKALFLRNRAMASIEDCAYFVVYSQSISEIAS